MLWKGVHPYEYMDDLEKLNEALLPEKDDFYSLLNMEDITDAGYAHAKRVCKDLETKKLGFVHCFYLMYLRIFEICVSKYISLILQNFFQLLD